MGVPGLMSFICNRQEVHGGAFQIKDVAAELKKCIKKPIIVIDFSGFAHVFVENKGEVLCGMRWQKLLEKLLNFFNFLIEAGADLVFFTENTQQDEKEETYMEGKTADYMRKLKIAEKINDNTPLGEFNDRECKIALNIWKKYLKQNLKTIGTWIRAFNREVDFEIAKYAKENDAFVVFSNDTDFLIYEGNFRLWTVREINFENKTVKELSRKNLRRALNLFPPHMPLFATLCGNDILPRNDLEEFHNSLSDPKHIYFFKKIAFFIRKQLPQNKNVSARDVEKIAAHAKVSQIKFMNSLNSYDCDSYVPDSDECDTELVMKCKREKSHVYVSLKRKPVRLGTFFEDVTQPTFGKTQCDLGLILERYQMGIILDHQRSADQEITKVYYLIDSQEARCVKKIVTPSDPPFKIPKELLERLLFRENDDNLDEKRKILLKEVIGKKLDVDELFKQSKTLIPVLATLCFLIEHTEVSCRDAEIILLSAYDLEQNRIPDELEAPERLNPRAFHLVFLYLNTLSHILRLFSTLGLKSFVVHPGFDGVHFHRLEQLDAEEKSQKLMAIQHLIKIMNEN